MSELATMAMDGTKSAADKANYNTEFTELKSYISDIGTKDFNGVSLFNGTALAVTKDSEGNTWSLNASSMNAVDVTSVIASAFTVTSSNAVRSTVPLKMWRHTGPKWALIFSAFNSTRAD